MNWPVCGIITTFETLKIKLIFPTAGGILHNFLGSGIFYRRIGALILANSSENKLYRIVYILKKCFLKNHTEQTGKNY